MKLWYRILIPIALFNFTACFSDPDPGSKSISTIKGEDKNLSQVVRQSDQTVTYAWAPWCKPCVSTIQGRMSRIKEVCDSLDVHLVCVAFIEDDKDEGFRRLNRELQRSSIPSYYYLPSGWHWNTRQAINELFLGELEGYEKSEAIPVILLVNDEQEVLRHKVPIYTDQSLVRAIQNAKNQS